MSYHQLWVGASCVSGLRPDPGSAGSTGANSSINVHTHWADSSSFLFLLLLPGSDPPVVHHRAARPRLQQHRGHEQTPHAASVGPVNKKSSWQLRVQHQRRSFRLHFFFFFFVLVCVFVFFFFFFCCCWCRTPQLELNIAACCSEAAPPPRHWTLKKIRTLFFYHIINLLLIYIIMNFIYIFMNICIDMLLL